MSLKPGAVPSKFSWTIVPQNKRKLPTPRESSAASKVVKTTTNISNNDEPTYFEAGSSLENTKESMKETIIELEQKLEAASKNVKNFEKKNEALRAKMTILEKQKMASDSMVFTVERFKSDEDICFYTGFPNYQAFLAVYNFLEPGEKGENIRYCTRSTKDRNVPDGFYDDNSDSDDLSSDEESRQISRRRGRPRALKPIEEYFLVLCRLRRGFAEQHLGHLFGISQSTVSRIFIPWINFMFLKFGQVCIWPSRQRITETMPESFKAKYPATRVIIDCTEVRCQMPSSLLLNSELFSSYKNHVTLKGLLGIAPSGAVTFISQLYTGNISDREIVTRSGLLNLEFQDGDLIMADKGFTVEDLLLLGVSINMPPFLGHNCQMSPEEVVETQQIASLRIHVERAINKIKNFHVWDGVIPLSLFGVVNQMWSVSAFLCNFQEPIISE